MPSQSLVFPGPILLAGNKPQADQVIGLAKFLLNPFANSAGELAKALENNRDDLIICGHSLRRFDPLASEAISSNSAGVGGLVSSEYAAHWLSEWQAKRLR